MTKIDFEYSIEKWITKFIEYDNELTLIEIFRNENISKNCAPNIKSDATSTIM